MEESAFIPSPFHIWTAQCLVSGTSAVSAPVPKVYLVGGGAGREKDC